MKRKEKEKEKQKLVPKKLRQILNKNKPNDIEKRGKTNKIKKMQISKTHSMENMSNINLWDSIQVDMIAEFDKVKVTVWSLSIVVIVLFNE